MPSFGISVVPSMADGVKHGHEVAYGWSVRIFRWLSDSWGSTAPYEKVQPLEAGPPTEGYVVVDLEEFEGRTTAGRKRRDVFVRRRLSFRCAHGITGWGSRWYELGSVEVMTPFQQSLPRDADVTYRLCVQAFLSNGEPLGRTDLSFANVPTYCLWDVELDRPGGVERVVDGRRILTGVRSVVLPADFTGEGRAGFVHAVGTFHLAAYDATGRKLWQRRDFSGVDVYNSTATRAFDVNGDGRDEVVTMAGRPPEADVLILEGTTGEILRRAPWPSNHGDLNRWHHGGNRGHVAYAYDAKLYIANFRGLEQPRDLVLQTGDENRPVYSVLTDELELLWEFDLREQRVVDRGAGAHCPVVYDIDGDGRDEMLAGTYLLDHDGRLLWMIPFRPTFDDASGDDHIDCADIGPVGPEGRLVAAFANNSVVADAGTGRTLWHGTSEHGQWAFIRRARLDLPGNQIIFADKKGPKRLYGHTGKELDWPAGGCSELGDWDGDGRAEDSIGQLVTDRHGRVIGVGAGQLDPLSLINVGVGEPCPLVSPAVTGSYTHHLGLNGTRARAFSGIPVPPPGKGRLTFPRHVYNHVD